MSTRLPALPPDTLAERVARAIGGEFALDRELGRGGMGVVYLARDLMLDRLVALKVLPAGAASDPTTRARFLREARTAARLAHPHIVPVHRADEVDGLAFFVMGYVEGESVGDRLRARGALPVGEAVRLLREVAWALAYAHARGVVHRDVKPENILLDRQSGRALVTDFGIARQLDGLADGDATRLTRDGHVLGTLHYLSPEQAMGGTLDGRSDLYSLGVVGWQLLSGRLPFADAQGPGVLVAHATRPAPPLLGAAPHVPPSVAAVIDRALAKRPDDRFATGEAFADALEQALAEAPEAVRAAGSLLPAGAPAVVSESEAAAIWRRAAQLQADALHRLEVRRDRLGEARSDAESVDAAAGFRLAAVAEAAREAGISAQYVAMALAELPKADATAATSLAATEDGPSERTATLILGTAERSLAVSQIVRASPARTLRALGNALRHSPYDLQLRETVGPHPLDGGVLVFDLPGPNAVTGAYGTQLPKYWFATRVQLEATQVHVTLRAVPGEPANTELTMTCDLRPGVRRNVRASQWIAGGVGGTTGTFTAAALAKGAWATIATAGIALPAVGVAAGLAAACLAWYRRLYPATLKRARHEMLGALQSVAGALQAEEVFGSGEQPAPPVRRPAD